MMLHRSVFELCCVRTAALNATCSCKSHMRKWKRLSEGFSGDTSAAQSLRGKCFSSWLLKQWNRVCLAGVGDFLFVKSPSVSGLVLVWARASAAGSNVTAPQRKSRQAERNVEEKTVLLEKLHAGCLVHGAECTSGRVSNGEDQTHT